MCLAGGATVDQKHQADLEGDNCVYCVPSAHPEGSSHLGGTLHRAGWGPDTGNGLL